MNKLVAVCFFCAFSIFAKAQKKYNPTPDDVVKAQLLNATLPDETIIILNKDIQVSFYLTNDDENVGVLIEEATEYMNVAASSKLQHGVFYDAESEIEDFQVLARNGKEIYINPSDEYLKSADLFHTDYRVRFVNLNFPLQGYTNTVKTVKKYNDIKYFTSTYFSDQYRTLNGKITFDIPEWLDFDIKEFNFEGYEIEKNNLSPSSLIYSFKNIPPQSEEVNTPGPSFIYPHFLFVAKSFDYKGKKKLLFNSTDDLYTWYNTLVKSVDVDTSVFQETVSQLIEGLSSDKEKIEAIFYWVQDNIRYVAFEDGIAGFKPDSPQNVYNKRYGDCKGMAFLTKSMLEEAGLDSRLVWIGTDRLAYDYSTPSLSVDNHMICAVYQNEEYIFLDATEKFNRLGDYATRIQSKQALVQNGDTYILKKVPVSGSVENLDAYTYNLSIEGESLAGSAIRAFNGESRVSFQNNYFAFGTGDQEEVLINFLELGNDNLEVSNIGYFDPSKRDESIIINYDVEMSSAVSSFDEYLYVDLDPFKRASSLVLEDRKSDVKLPLLEKDLTQIELTIPDGYSLEELPGDYRYESAIVSILLSYEQEGNKVLFKKLIEPKTSLIKKEQFQEWNDAFKGLKEANSEQVVFKK